MTKVPNLSIVLLVTAILLGNCKTLSMQEKVLGQTNPHSLRKDPECGWLADTTGYIPDPVVLERLRSMNWKTYSWKVYLGCWCSDSRKLVPAFREIGNSLGWKEEQITWFALDMDKKSPEQMELKDNVEYLPTFILYRDGKEAGRIVESVDSNLESAILGLF